jgi:tRNA pseudouridine38-40 synthase
VEWPRRVLEGRDRGKAGQTAPPQGLVFTAARYEAELPWV